jgi:UDP-N-acetylglucosamine 3-dehydrogenase
MVKVGVIGTGYWGRHHLRIFSKLKCELVGIADVDPRRIDLAKEYHTGFYTDYKKLLKKVDAVSIVTPPSIHYKIAKKAISSGKHVLLEKPFVFKVKEARILAALAKSQRIS